MNDPMTDVYDFLGGKPETPIQSRDSEANPFKHLDLTWKPLLKVTLPCSDPGGDFAPTKFRFGWTTPFVSNLYHKFSEDQVYSRGPSVGPLLIVCV